MAVSNHILVEGDSDEAILKAILPETREGVRYWRSQGRGSMLSLARSLLANSGGQVAVVLDADTTDKAAVEELRKNARKLLELAGDEAENWALIVFIPEIEEIFLQDDGILKSLGASAATVRTLRADGHRNSRDVFRSILSRKRKSMDEWLKATDLSRFRERTPIEGLVTFLRAHGVRIPAKPTKQASRRRGRS